ncbi:hypothetical protein HMPREF0682_2251 [Propionibacterium acidifaciens F0233]|uniref:Uncharacterized protein n=1 Tax=Propionibacterium acidifaciens F0233 TaxID=553198 RepID=U2S7W2_9ACTN|nr:hypothetical protein HMPREF0682_2251 [Propionibacterium acidifaciens F0233]
MSPTHVTAGALAAWFLRGSAPAGPEGLRPGRWYGLSSWACKGVMSLEVMIFWTLWRAGLDSVAGGARPGCGRWS